MTTTADRPAGGGSGPGDGELDDLVEEIAGRLQAGEPVDVEEYARRHPAQAASLRRLLPSLELMARLGRSVAGSIRDGGPAPAPSVGPGVLGDFRIVREVGRGGMGVVYEAEQISLGRRVALKVLPFAAAIDPRHLRRFHVEAQAAAGLHHTHIVPVYSVGCERGLHYYAMQFIEGRTLAEVVGELRRLDGPATADAACADDLASTLARGLTSGRPDREATGGEAGHSDDGRVVDPDAGARVAEPPGPHRPVPPSTGSATRSRAYCRAAARLGLQAAEALEYAHEQAVLHRDIKPSNLLVDAGGKLWVTDFGLARFQGDAGLTATGDLLGTLRYMSPEQALAKRAAIDHRTDIYSLGVTLYELLALRPAFEGGDRQEILRRIAEEEPPPPRRLNPAVPRDLETIVLKAMDKDPAARYPDAGAMAADLRRFLEDRPIRARRPTLPERTARWARRHRGAVATAAAMLAVMALGSAVGLVVLARQRDEARAQRRLAEARLGQALDAVDRMLTRVARDRLAPVPRMERVRRELLEDALEFYERFLRERPADAAMRRQVARACRRVGILRHQLGQLEGSERAFRRALEVWGSLAAATPGASEDVGGLAISHHDLGLLLKELGRSGEAERAFRLAVELLEPVTAGSPDTPGFRRDLAASHNDLGILLREAGRVAEAERAHRRAVELREALAAEFPGVTDYRRDVAASQSDLGILLKDAGRAEEAERAFRRATEEGERLVADAPDVPNYRRELAVGLCNLGRLLLGLGRLDEAERAYGRAEGLLKALAADFPGIADHRKQLAECLGNMGLLLRRTGRAEEAERAHRRAAELLEALTADFPGVAEYRRALAVAQNDLANLLLTTGRPAEAERAYGRAVEILEMLVAGSSGVPDDLHFLGTSQGNLALVRVNRGDLAGARELVEKAISNIRAALDLSPRHPTYLRVLRDGYGFLGQILVQSGDHREAARVAEGWAAAFPDRWQDALSAADLLGRCAALAKSDARCSESERRDLGRGYVERARGLLGVAAERAGDDPEAQGAVARSLADGRDPRLRDPSRAVALAERAVASRPEDGGAWSTLGLARYRGGDWSGAIEALERSTGLSPGVGGRDWFVLALAHRARGDEGQARTWYGRAVEWAESHAARDEGLDRLHEEAAKNFESR